MSHRNLPRWLVAALVAAAVAAATALLFFVVLGSDDGPKTYDYMIPAGTGARIDAGEPVSILPAKLEVRVGDRLVIENLDDREHVVGPFLVGEGERLEQEFRRPGVQLGLCTVHESGSLEIVIRP